MSIFSDNHFKINRKQNKALVAMCLLFVTGVGCQNKAPKSEEAKISLLTLDPGHFHAALIQKSMYNEISPVVHVYAPEGPELEAHLKLIEKYNSRADDPTAWQEVVYKGEDYLQKMLDEKKGNVVILAGNNQKKTDYIQKSVAAGINVLSDKPMAIDAKGFEQLEKAFESAEKSNVLLYDIMTERYEITNMLQKELSLQQEVFGTLEKGTAEKPAITKESVHHFFKYVSGAPLIRPQWYFDVEQEGNGLVDVTTHLVDMIQWECFADQHIDYKKDVNMLSAKRWATLISPSQFKKSTGADSYPAFLQKDVKDSILNVYSNGEMNYTLKGVHAKVSVIWNFEAPEGTGDTHYSVMHGTKASLIIKQGAAQQYKPTLYIEPQTGWDKSYETVVKQTMEKLTKTYPGLELKAYKAGWEVIIPVKYNVGHEAHFAEVAKKYFGYLKERKLPDWEKAALLSKYYTTTKALEFALKN
ncbi:putative oxidoreductase C-terminal domain-containing protein [Pedobacter heparinus]|uniref:putative oxidoreductase C-terminal domain-containing protein n=1 Tax=Pedobacter heparinus TaxID=984 RepID=UPI0029300B43|nr:putative oxidoreductase C-terminal domain-containing protein [Pedobacter heparinus]